MFLAGETAVAEAAVAEATVVEVAAAEAAAVETALDSFKVSGLAPGWWLGAARAESVTRAP